MLKPKPFTDIIVQCSDKELVAIVRSTNPAGSFAEERKLALAEMAKRAARAYRVKFDQYDCLRFAAHALSEKQGMIGKPPKGRQP
jgi:hypothetical protein